MTRFAYQIRNELGQVESGVIDAYDATEAGSQLRQQGKMVMSLEAESEAGAPGPKLKKIRSDDLIFFANQLAVMVDTGVPLSEALDAIADSSDHTGLQAMVREISEDVKGGVEFSRALENYPKVFNDLFISLIRASEASGTMGPMLQRASAYLVQVRDTRKQVKGAMIYPVCMLGFCILVIVGLLVFVLPKFENIYSGKGKLLPGPTRALMSLSNGMVTYWPFILVGLGAVVGGLIYYLRTPGGRLMRDKVLLSVPVFGPMVRKACMARSLRTMSTMVTTGVAMLDGLEITARVAGNAMYRQLWLDMADHVREGGTLSDRLFACPLIPRTIAQMIDAGERTGQLGNVMDRIANFCEDDLKIALKAATGMIEPVMVIVMGLIVGGIAMALLLPIFKMSSTMAGG